MVSYNNELTLLMFSRLNNIKNLLPPRMTKKYKRYAIDLVNASLLCLVKYSKGYEFLKEKNIFINLHLVVDQEIEEINLNYRDKKEPTNVISLSNFSNEELKKGSLSLNLDLGEIFISFETLIREAIEQNVIVESYFYKLLVHGLLHLLGFDHKVEEQAIVMYSMEETILKELRIRTPSIVENYWSNT